MKINLPAISIYFCSLAFQLLFMWLYIGVQKRTPKMSKIVNFCCNIFNYFCKIYIKADTTGLDSIDSVFINGRGDLLSKGNVIVKDQQIIFNSTNEDREIVMIRMFYMNILKWFFFFTVIFLTYMKVSYYFTKDIIHYPTELSLLKVVLLALILTIPIPFFLIDRTFFKGNYKSKLFNIIKANGYTKYITSDRNTIYKFSTNSELLEFTSKVKVKKPEYLPWEIFKANIEMLYFITIRELIYYIALNNSIVSLPDISNFSIAMFGTILITVIYFIITNKLVQNNKKYISEFISIVESN